MVKSLQISSTTRKGIITRLRKVNNSLISQARAVQFMYNDLPLAGLNGLDSSFIEAADAIWAAQATCEAVLAELQGVLIND